MSAFGTKRTSQPRRSMSAFGGKADITRTFPMSAFGPKADIAYGSLAARKYRTSFQDPPPVTAEAL